MSLVSVVRGAGNNAVRARHGAARGSRGTWTLQDFRAAGIARCGQHRRRDRCPATKVALSRPIGEAMPCLRRCGRRGAPSRRSVARDSAPAGRGARRRVASRRSGGRRPGCESPSIRWIRDTVHLVAARPRVSTLRFTHGVAAIVRVMEPVELSAYHSGSVGLVRSHAGEPSLRSAARSRDRWCPVQRTSPRAQRSPRPRWCHRCGIRTSVTLRVPLGPPRERSSRSVARDGSRRDGAGGIAGAPRAPRRGDPGASRRRCSLANRRGACRCRLCARHDARRAFAPISTRSPMAAHADPPAGDPRRRLVVERSECRAHGALLTVRVRSGTRRTLMDQSIRSTLRESPADPRSRRYCPGVGKTSSVLNRLARGVLPTSSETRGYGPLQGRWQSGKCLRK